MSIFSIIHTAFRSCGRTITRAVACCVRSFAIRAIALTLVAGIATSAFLGAPQADPSSGTLPAPFPLIERTVSLATTLSFVATDRLEDEDVYPSALAKLFPNMRPRVVVLPKKDQAAVKKFYKTLKSYSDTKRHVTVLILKTHSDGFASLRMGGDDKEGNGVPFLSILVPMLQKFVQKNGKLDVIDIGACDFPANMTVAEIKKFRDVLKGPNSIAKRIVFADNIQEDKLWGTTPVFIGHYIVLNEDDRRFHELADDFRFFPLHPRQALWNKELTASYGAITAVFDTTLEMDKAGCPFDFSFRETVTCAALRRKRDTLDAGIQAPAQLVKLNRDYDASVKMGRVLENDQQAMNERQRMLDKQCLELAANVENAIRQLHPYDAISLLYNLAVASKPNPAIEAWAIQNAVFTVLGKRFDRIGVDSWECANASGADTTWRACNQDDDLHFDAVKFLLEDLPKGAGGYAGEKQVPKDNAFYKTVQNTIKEAARNALLSPSWPGGDIPTVRQLAAARHFLKRGEFDRFLKERVIDRLDDPSVPIEDRLEVFAPRLEGETFTLSDALHTKEELRSKAVELARQMLDASGLPTGEQAVTALMILSLYDRRDLNGAAGKLIKRVQAELASEGRMWDPVVSGVLDALAKVKLDKTNCKDRRLLHRFFVECSERQYLISRKSNRP